MLASVLAGLSILIIGDSHLTYFLINSLHDGLANRGAHVHTLGVCGTAPGDWLAPAKATCGAAERRGGEAARALGPDARIPSVGTLIEHGKPDVVVIVISDTIGGFETNAFPKTWAWQQVTSLTKTIADAGTRCIWVGPAWGADTGKYHKTVARTEQIAAFLKSNVAPCQYIDSLKFSKPGQWKTIDGVHFTQPGYQAWGAALAKSIVESPLIKEVRKTP